MSDHNGKRMTGAQCLITALEDAGVDTVFGYPGGHAIDIYDALYESEVLDHVLVRHEQGAVHAADGYARATGRPGTVIVTSGPGATNTVTGIATAYMDSIPLVVITGQVPTDALGSDAFQESDMTGITLPIVKHSYLVKNAEDLPETIAKAYHIASTGRPGPVVIDVPRNLMQEQEVAYSFPKEVKIQSYKPTVKGNARQIKQAVRAIEEAQRPVIYAGGGIVSSGAHDALERLAELMQAPVVTTLEGKGAISEASPFNMGMLGMYGEPAANLAMRESDLIIAVGTRFSDRSMAPQGVADSEAQVIHIDIDPAEIGKNHKADIPIVGDAKTVLTQLADELARSEFKAHAQEWLSTLDGWKDEFAPTYEERGDAIMPERVFQILDELVANDEVIFTTEVGQHQMWASRYLHTKRPRTFLSSGGAGTMGFGLPAAMGAQLAFPESLVICIAGDGSLQMNIQEMATIKANRLPVKVLLLDNDCLGMVRQIQERLFDARYSQTLFEGNPDFSLLAQAYGWSAYEVDAPDELERTMREWVESSGPSLLWVKVVPDENVLPMMTSRTSIEEAFAGAIHSGDDRDGGA